MVGYWRCLLWVNMVLAVVHAFYGHIHMFLALGLALVSRLMIDYLENTEK